MMAPFNLHQEPCHCSEIEYFSRIWHTTHSGFQKRGTVRIPCCHLNHGESEMKWYQLDNAAGKIRLTLEMKRVLCEDDSVAGYLRDKMLDAVEIILKLMETWGVRAGLSVSFTRQGFFRFSVYASIDGLKTTVTKVEDLSEVKEIAGEKTKMNAADIEEQKKSWWTICASRRSPTTW
eukprot:726384_1